MKMLMFCIMLAMVAFSCVRTVQPLPPSSLKSAYRKTVEVLLVSCEQNSGRREPVSVVESTETGERFQVHGCYGKPGDRFKISY